MRLGLYSLGIFAGMSLLGANMSINSSPESSSLLPTQPLLTAAATAADTDWVETPLDRLPMTDDLQQTIDAWALDQDAPISVVVTSTSTGDSVAYNDQQTFVSASLYKLYSAYELLLQEQDAPGRLTTAATIEYSGAECLELMIVVSNNLCAFNLGRSVGWQNTNQTLTSLGLTSTDVNNYNSDGELVGDKYTTAADMNIFLQELHGGDSLSQEYRDLLLDLMLAQELNDVLPQNIPEGTEIAHKTGDIEGFVHNAGYIIAPSDTYSYVILTSDQPTLEAGNKNIQQLLAGLLESISVAQ